MAGETRESGFGHIRKRGNNHAAEFPNPYYGQPGEPKRVYKTFARRRAAEHWLAKEQAAIEAGTWLSPHQRENLTKSEARTFSEVADHWFATCGNKPSTKASDKRRYDKHLNPYWGDVPIKTITTPQVWKWLTNLLPDSHGARKKVYEEFRTIMAVAVDDGLLDRSPCTRKMSSFVNRVEKSQRHQPRALTPQEFNALVEDLPASTATLVYLMGTTGLRIGEARELRRKDVNLRAGYLTVRRAVSGDGSDRAVDTPKTAAGTRQLPLAAPVVERLKAHLKEQGPRDATALLFPSPVDPAIHIGESTVRQNIYRSCDRRKVKRVSPHDLRHTAATYAARTPGATVKDVQAILGQSTPNMAIRYMKTDEAQQQALSDGIASALLGADPKVIPLKRAGNDD